MRAETTDIYRSFFDAAPDAVVAVDASGRIVDTNEQVTALFGYTRDELLGQPIDELVPVRFRGAHAAHRARYGAHPASRPMGAGLDLWARHRDGLEFPVDVSLSAATVDGTRLTLAAVRDVSARRRSEQALRESEHRFRRMFEDAPFGMAMIDRDHRLHQVNDALRRLLDAEANDDLTGCTLDELTPPEDSIRYVEVLAQLFAGELTHATIEKRLLTRTGRVVWAAVTFSALGPPAADDALAVVMVEDITIRKQTEARLTHLATHDELTGLANRSLLTDRLRQAQARSARSGQMFAVLFVDLDGFKHVNDEFGHDAGDAVLAEAGRRIAATVRPVDTAARHGGDEFVVCCEDLGDNEPHARATIQLVADRLFATLAEPFVAADHEVALSACIGVVLSRDDVATPAGLVADADKAMYSAKALGHGRIAYAD